MSEKVLILGLSKSGIAAAFAAIKRGNLVYITESKEPKKEYSAQIEKLISLGAMI